MRYSFLQYAYLYKKLMIFLISNKFPNDADVAAQGPYFENHRTRGGLTAIPHLAYVITCCELHATELRQRLFTVLRHFGW